MTIEPRPTQIAEADRADPQALGLPAEPAPIVAIDEPVEVARAARIAQIAGNIDLGDTSAVLSFGSEAQTELTQISQQMLDGVRNKDTGPAGDALREIVTTIKGFSVGASDARSRKTFVEKIFGLTTPFVKFKARFETVQQQIDQIADALLGHERVLARDVKMLDMLYDKTLAYYDELGHYIAAGELVLTDLDTNRIPPLAAGAEIDGEDAIVAAQQLRDLRAVRDDLERRVHDLKLTRQVTMQSLPSIRMVQENDKSLAMKINSTLVNTVPLWETQMAQAITIQRSSDAAAAVRQANDLTNELLTANAANLRSANAAVRRELERGVFDIEAVKLANSDLVATIEESLQIADEGKAHRADAEQELVKLENELKTVLRKASGDR